MSITSANATDATAVIRNNQQADGIDSSRRPPSSNQRGIPAPTRASTASTCGGGE